MSDITISVIQPPSTTINVGVDETTLIQAGIGLPPHSVTHISGGSDEINHNLLAGLQGGSGDQYYHLSSGQYFNLVTGTGAFYPNSNPSGFITGINNIVFITGNQTISGVKTFSNNLIVGGNDLFVDTSNDRVGIFTATPMATLDVNGSGLFRSGLNITGILNINNSGGLFNTTLITNGALEVNNAKFGGWYWTAESGVGIIMGDYLGNNGISILDTEININAISTQINGPVVINNGILTGTTGVFLNSLIAPNLIYTTGNQIISGAKTFTGSFNVSTHDPIIIRSTGYTHGVEIGGGYYNKIADGGFINDFGVNGVENHFGDSATSSNSFGGNASQNDFGAYATLNNYYGGSVIGQFDFDTLPTVNSTGVLLSGEATTESYVTGISGNLQSQITTLNNQTGSFYPRTNPSGYITGINNLVFTTGNQTISGTKTFSNNLVVGGNDLFVNTSTDRVGIFTDTPTATLDVNGSGVFRSGLNVIGTGTIYDTALNINGALSVNNSYFDGAIWQPNPLDGYVAIANFDAVNYIEVSDFGVTLEASTKSFQVYAPTRMHYALTGTTGRFTSIVEAPNLVYNTGNQTIGGAKTFSNNLTVNGGDLFVNTSNNRVGVNTITPTATLDVNGSVLFRSGLNISGTRPTVNSTGILLSGEATTQTYVTGISGGLQTQITTLNNQTGSYYPRTNPSGYITGVDLSFSGNYYTKNESESRYVNTTGTETILGDKTFHDKVYINNLYVTGLETIINTTNTNVASNYLLLNLTGGAVDGGIFFITGSGLTGINDSGAIIGFDHSDKFKFGIGTRASDLSILNTIAAYEEVTGISGGLQIQISTLNSATGNYALKIETGNFITNSQTGQFYANSNPSGFITGVDLSSYATQDYVTGISGELQTQITNLNNATGSYILNSQTGDFYASSNPSGFITGIENIVFTTGDQTISGIKTFSTGVNVTGDVNINGNLTISGQYNVYQQIENAKILAIAYAIAL